MVTLQKSTQELICQSLRNRIASGDLEPGTELKQVELARTYGVSRMPSGRPSRPCCWKGW